MKKIKDLLIAITDFAYIVVIGDMVVNNERYIFREQWLLLLVIILLSIGFYYFIKYNENK